MHNNTVRAAQVEIAIADIREKSAPPILSAPGRCGKALAEPAAQGDAPVSAGSFHCLCGRRCQEGAGGGDRVDDSDADADVPEQTLQSGLGKKQGGTNGFPVHRGGDALRPTLSGQPASTFTGSAT